MNTRSTNGFAIIDLLFVCAIISIISGIALPRLMAARGAATAASAIGSMRVIGTSQVTFAITCGSGFYAPNLTSLGKLPPGAAAGFISEDLGAVDAPNKSDYLIQMSSTSFAGAPDTCNFIGVGQTGQAFKAAADPNDPANPRYFGINAGNVIYEDKNSYWGTMPEAGEPPSGAPIKF